MNISKKLIEIAKDCARNRNLSAKSSKEEKSSFEPYLRTEIKNLLLQNYSEKVLSKRCSYRVDYFIEEEASVIELELSSNGSNTNFERDCWKVIIAKDEGCYFSV